MFLKSQMYILNARNINIKYHTILIHWINFTIQSKENTNLSWSWYIFNSLELSQYDIHIFCLIFFWSAAKLSTQQLPRWEVKRLKAKGNNNNKRQTERVERTGSRVSCGASCGNFHTARSNFTHLHSKTHTAPLSISQGKVSSHSGSERSCRSPRTKKKTK